MKAVRAIVMGRVQGVFFRASTAERARELGVSGWVRNLSDGNVEAHLEGADDAVGPMLDFLRSGPPSARVDEVETRTIEPGGHEDFTVRS